MDAKRYPAVILLAVATPLLLCGCGWFGVQPTQTKPSATDEQKSEPPMIVQKPADPSAKTRDPAAAKQLGDPVDPPPVDPNVPPEGKVRDYIAQIDNARQLAQIRKTQPKSALKNSRETNPDDRDRSASEFAAADSEALPARVRAEDKLDPASGTTLVNDAAGAESTPTEAKVRPPTLGTVAARGSESRSSPAPAENQPAGINATAVARNGPASLRELLDQLPPSERNGSFREQLDARIMWVAAGDYERARQPLDLVTAEQQQLATGIIESWIALRESHMGDMNSAATHAGKELDALREALRKLSDLSVPTLSICRAVRGFGQYDPIDPARFPSGAESEFVLYCEVRDFVSEKQADGNFVTQFALTTTILTRSGDTVLEIKDENILDRSRNRRQDCFIPRLVRLPATLAPGQYVAKVTLADKLGKKVAENRAAFQITAAQ